MTYSPQAMLTPRHAIALGCLLAGSLSLPGRAAAGEALPRWEAGVAVGAASLPQYMGSDERYTLALPLPFAIYRSERLNLDRDGLRAELFGSKRLWLDASLGAGLPVRNSNRARAGMPALHFNLQAGPRLNWRFNRNTRSDWVLRLPWRGVMDIKGHGLGWLMEPELRVQLRPGGRFAVRLSAGALFASQRFNAAYYGVDPLYATATRPAYSAHAGLHSLKLGGALYWMPSARLRVFTTVSYRNLSPGVVAGSPLVKTPHYLAAGAGVAWSFYQSDERAPGALED